ncbi:MAG: RNA-binding S4 domain-containing protein [Proteobacteria bacterium]|nr:RNA-binding S4 domain-containing protein [Pseudomonadota bacterium]
MKDGRRRLALELRGEYIALDALLKATGIAPSGGAARQMIVDGHVQVDGIEERRKTRKLRAGQIVSVADAEVSVLGPAPSDRNED